MKRLKQLLLILSILAVGFFGWKYRASLNPEIIRTWIAQFGSAGPVIYVFLYALNTVTLLPPIAFLSLSAGLAFGPAIGFVVILAGAMVGTTATFLISRYLGRGFVERFLKGKFKSLDEKLEQNGFSTVFFFRMVPIVPYEPLNYLSGLSKIKFRDYGLATLLGLIPGAGAAAFLGDALVEPFSKRFFIVVGAYLAYMVLVFLISSKTGKKASHAIS